MPNIQAEIDNNISGGSSQLHFPESPPDYYTAIPGLG